MNNIRREIALLRAEQEEYALLLASMLTAYMLPDSNAQDTARMIVDEAKRIARRAVK